MNRKDILQLLQDFSVQDGDTYEQRSIPDSYFGDIADKLAAPTPTPPVTQGDRVREFTLEQVKYAYRAGAKDNFMFAGLPSELSKCIEDNLTDYIKFKFNIDPAPGEQGQEELWEELARIVIFEEPHGHIPHEKYVKIKQSFTIHKK